MKIAITGGIGSGKSAVCAILKNAGYNVVSADEIAAEVNSEPAVIERLRVEFPSCVSGGMLDKAALSAIVFCDKEKRKVLEQITHPIIMQRMIQQMQGGLVFAEVPLLFEGNYSHLFDGVIVVIRDKQSRLAAVKERGLSPEQAEMRMASQIDYATADFSGCELIVNDGDITELKDKVMKAVARLIDAE